MTTASKITLVRVALIPFFMVFLLLHIHGGADWLRWAALATFVVARVSDFLDGYIARHCNQVSDFGKFLDPLADKALVMAALAVFVELDEVNMNAIPFIIIIAREFMVSGLRLLAADSGVVVAAGIWGKLKTAFTMVTIIAILFWLFLKDDFGGYMTDGIRFFADSIAVPVLVWISAALTVISGGVYLKGYWHLIDSDK